MIKRPFCHYNNQSQTCTGPSIVCRNKWGRKVTDASRFFQISKYLAFWRPVLPGNLPLSPPGWCFNWETLTQGTSWHSVGLNWNEAGSVMLVPSQVKRTKIERGEKKGRKCKKWAGKVAVPSRFNPCCLGRLRRPEPGARLRLKSPFSLGETPVCHHLCWGQGWGPKTSVLRSGLLHSLLPWSWNEFRAGMDLRQVKCKKLG